MTNQVKDDRMIHVIDILNEPSTISVQMSVLFAVIPHQRDDKFYVRNLYHQRYIIHYYITRQLRNWVFTLFIEVGS